MPYAALNRCAHFELLGCRVDLGRYLWPSLEVLLKGGRGLEGAKNSGSGLAIIGT